MSSSSTISPQQRALIIMAHGSRRSQANEEFFELVRDIEKHNTDYALTRAALLEQAPPTLMEVCTSLPEGIIDIDIYPLFFNCGKHVERDIPRQIAEVMELMPSRSLRLLPYFGSSPQLARWVLQHVAQTNTDAQRVDDEL